MSRAARPEIKNGQRRSAKINVHLRPIQSSDLYQAILARRSVRRYAPQPLNLETRAQIQEIISKVKPLVSDNRFHVLMHDVEPGEDLVQKLGAYGRIVTPPHYIVPYIVGETHPLIDLGYRVEQIAVRLAARDVGTCYIGSLGREGEVSARFELPEAARIGAFLVFGHPANSLGGRAFNAGVRWVVGATNKLSVDRIFFHESFDNLQAPPIELAPIVEAARHAPSATNTQPWRFLWRDGTLYFFVRRDNPRYGEGPGTEYRFYDGGICMANVALALEALELPGQWQLPQDNDPDLPHHPADLQPLAKLLVRTFARVTQ